MSSTSALSLNELRALLRDEIKRRPPLQLSESFSTNVLRSCGHLVEATFYSWDLESKSRIDKIIDWTIRQRCKKCQFKFELEMEELNERLAIERQLDYEKYKAILIATDEGERLRAEVKELCLGGEELFDAIELVTNDPYLRLNAFERVRGWYVARLTHGVKKSALAAVMDPVFARLNRGHLRLLRAAPDCFAKVKMDPPFLRQLPDLSPEEDTDDTRESEQRAMRLALGR